MYQWKVYIKPFDDTGAYAEYIDVTDDVDFSGFGKINADLDNTEFDIGVYRYSNFSIKMNNLRGAYGDVDDPESIFRFKRTGSLVKVTWRFGNAPICGVARTDSEDFLGEETDIFIGLLSDEGSRSDLGTQNINFSVLGRESLFAQTVVPFGSISNGDLMSEVIYACLNQSAITDLLIVSPSNISCSLDFAIDSIASLQNKTVQEGLNKLLLASNSVLFIDGDTVKVQPRTASVDTAFEFFGPGSVLGSENVIDVSDIRNGIARIINFATWKSTTLSAENTTSRTRYNTKKKEFDFEFVTDNTKRSNVLTEIVEEFGDPKQEFSLVTRLSYAAFAVDLLDKVTLDYPLIPIRGDGDLPLYGASVYGDSTYPVTLYSFFVLPDNPYKVLGKSVDPKSGTITFRLRRI